ncbi:cytochrome P450 3A8-like [Mizuhopecten yessoensis]|uniref:cytochrome P450 3A8-like n=1 Tax=Mizuhopecten yessoensis TaxID=6573 RepID=UPI000B4578F2|nr:cytochrome P450 3A8-like [Mizuhopecten yessoensis]
MGIPDPTPLPIVGNMVAMLSEGLRAFDRNAIQKYGKVFGHFDVLSTNLVVADKEMLREILVKQFNNFPDRRTVDGFAGDLEHGLVNVKGSHWKHNRRIITPTFSSGKLRQMMPLIQEACDTLVKTSQNLMESGDDGQVEMRRLFGGYTMDGISSTAFGIHVDSQSNQDDLFVMHAKKMFDISFTKPWMLVVSLDRIRILMYFLQLMIDAQEGKLKLDDDEEDSKEQNNWSSEGHQGLTFDEILGNAKLFFVAGYETTALTPTMNAYNLATNPECQERLRQEIEEKLGSEVIDFENVKKLHYLDMCMNETLRMYPPAMRVNRMCVKTTKVNDITIPAGMTVTVPILAMQHDPEVWEKPVVFNPERFSASERDKHDPMDFLPFGYGPRNCVGMRLALMETKMATAHIVRNFKMCVGSKTEIPLIMKDKSNLLKPVSAWLKLEQIK